MTRLHFALAFIAIAALTVISVAPQTCTDSLPGLGGRCHPLAELVVDDCTPVCRCPR